MLQSRFIQLLKLLNADELSRFGRYLASPYVNEREKPRELLELCSNYFPEYDSPKLAKEKVFSRLFPQEAYTDIKMRQLLSYTTGKLQDFLAHLQFCREEQGQEMALLQSLNEREAEKPFSQLYNTLEQQISDIRPDASNYLQQYQLLQTFNDFSEKQAQKKGRKLEVKLDAASDKLDLFYLSSKLRLYCDILNYKSIMAHPGELPLIPQLLEHVAQHDYSHAPAVQIYYHAAHCLSGAGEEHFKQLRDLLATHAARFTQEEARSMYGMAQNYCIRKINSGEGVYLTELLNIYRSLLQSGIILEKGELSPWDFKNIVAVALRVGETDWTLKFISKHSEYIAAEHRDNAISYNMAKYYYQVKQFDKVLDLLQQVTYNDIFYNLDSKVTLLKTYYELDETDAMLGFTDTFSTFLRRQKQVSKFHRDSYLKLIKYVKKLATTPPGNKERLNLLEKDIDLTPGLPDKLWLKEKIGELR
jgi:hypothetical protein